MIVAGVVAAPGDETIGSHEHATAIGYLAETRPAAEHVVVRLAEPDAERSDLDAEFP